MIRITSIKDGFRRCGVAHPKEPTEYPDDQFSAKELKILDGEPMLFVERIKSKSGKIAKTPPLKDMTVAGLQELLTKLKVPYDSKALKDDLIKLVEKNTAKPPKE